MTVTMGKRGTLVIPKTIRDQCQFAEGTKIDVSLENKAIVLLPSVNSRTRMDENFEEARALLTSKGVSLEMALAKLTQIKARAEQGEGTATDERLVAP